MLPPPPLSPHLQIYKPQWTSVASILHRLTGIALCGGYALVSLWIFMTSWYPEALPATSWVLKLVVVKMVTALVYHLLNGLRHLIWDMGHGMDIPTVERTAKWVFMLTAMAWGGTLYGVLWGGFSW